MRRNALAVACLVAGTALGLGALSTDRELRDWSPIRAAHAQTPKVGLGVQEGVYFPNTETLAPDEMRVIALGTGMPTPLTRAQKSTNFMVELGNGDIFLFDCGAGSVENLFAIQPRFSKIDKVFVSHYHTDHVADVDNLWVGGWGSGRYTPLHIYGPSGSTPALGATAFVEGLKMAYAWDVTGRSGAWPDAGGKLIAHEFDYKKPNQVVYEANGVRITSFPAIHSLDGPVGYRLDWQGLSFVFGGDSVPNRWFMEAAKGADLVIHESIYTPEGMNRFFGWNNMRTATYVAAYIHTPPAAFGKMMSVLKPRMAVAYHAILLPELLQEATEQIRSTYDGPLTIASDLFVWNVTKDEITVREAVVAERVYPPPAGPEWGRAKRTGEAKVSDEIMGGVWEGYTFPPLPER